MLQFEYTNQVPLAARPGTNTNKIRLWRDDDGILHYDRRYVCEDGTINDTPIEHTFNKGVGSFTVARNIHWGCCGWDANSQQLASLIDKVRDFVDET